MGENIGEFDELLANRQSFLPEMYSIFNIHILFVGHLPKCSPNNLIQIAEFTNIYSHQCFLLYGSSIS